MSDVTQILSQIDRENTRAAEDLLPLVYDELRALAVSKISRERPGQTLQPTALVHEAYVRLVERENDRAWDSRGHFFAAAAEAMRRILIEGARRKSADKRGGNHIKLSLCDADGAVITPPEELLSLDEALEKLALSHPEMAELVKLRFFAGLSNDETARMLGFSERTTRRKWTYARAWLRREMQRDQI